MSAKIKVATTSLAGCFGCHMSLLDIDERLFELVERVDFDRSPLTDIKHCGPCDLGIIEGGLCNAENVHVLREFRKNCKFLVAMGACAINGGLPAQRNHLDLADVLAEANRRAALQVVAGQEADRHRVARELHDELGQGLSALKLELSACVDDTLPARHRERVHSMLKRMDEIVAAVRRIAVDLRPQMLDDLGLGAAVEWLVQDFARRAGLRCETHIDDVGVLGDSVATALYRMVQEALTNVLRHAQATDVAVELCLRDGRVRLSVRDNGVGLQDERMPRDSQFGLLGMQERADMLGGQLQLTSTQGGGTCVCMELPLQVPQGTRRP